jgi:hypothetical protein
MDGGTCFHLQNEAGSKQSSTSCLLHACFFFCLACSSTLKMEVTCSPKYCSTFVELHGDISQKLDNHCCGNLTSYTEINFRSIFLNNNHLTRHIKWMLFTFLRSICCLLSWTMFQKFSESFSWALCKVGVTKFIHQLIIRTPSNQKSTAVCSQHANGHSYLCGHSFYANNAQWVNSWFNTIRIPQDFCLFFSTILMYYRSQDMSCQCSDYYLLDY